MGTVEVQDQVDAVMYCVKKGFVDPARVAVTGKNRREEEEGENRKDFTGRRRVLTKRI